jgi:hypothetical protein
MDSLQDLPEEGKNIKVILGGQMEGYEQNACILQFALMLRAQKVSRGLPIAPAACEFRLGCRLTDYEWPHVMKAQFQLPCTHFLEDAA